MVRCVEHGCDRREREEEGRERRVIEHSSQVGRHLLLDSNTVDRQPRRSAGSLTQNGQFSLGEFAGRLGIVLERVGRTTTLRRVIRAMGGCYQL